MTAVQDWLKTGSKIAPRTGPWSPQAVVSFAVGLLRQGEPADAADRGAQRAGDHETPARRFTLLRPGLERC